MKKTVVIGRPNAGKTLFMINFAEYLGIKKIFLTQEFPDGRILNKEMSIDNARSNLSSSKEFNTQCVQGVEVKIPVYKGKKQFKLLDTSGFEDGIHPSLNIRNGIIQTLEKIKEADLIFHLIDISILANKGIISQIDKQIIEFGKTKRGYLLLPNKTDIDSSAAGLSRLKQDYLKTFMIPISAKYKDGFDEVKSFVIRSI